MDFAFNSAPTMIKDFSAKLEDHDKQRIKTVRVWLELNRAAAFQSGLWPSSVEETIETAFWGEDESKRPDSPTLLTHGDTVFLNVSLEFSENGKKRLSLGDVRIENVTVKPISGKALQIKCQALAITTDGDLEALHDMLKSNGVNMTAVQGAPSEGD